MANSRREGMEGILRVLRHRLVIPLHRSRHAPEYTARGVLVGLFIAFTPTVGIQMGIAAAVWALFRGIKRSWDFNLIVAMAWTWVTNVVTVPPVYYLFFETGRLFLGRSDPSSDYDAFADRVDRIISLESGWLADFGHEVAAMVNTFGLPLFVGCLPWAVVISIVGYAWSLRFVRRFRRLRVERRHKRRLRHPSP